MVDLTPLVPFTPKKTIKALPSWAKNDVYWFSSLSILCSIVDKHPAKFHNLLYFVDLDESTIDFFAIKRVVSSCSQERVMVNLAAGLFSNTHEFNLSSLDCLDEGNMKLALKAIKLRFRK